MLVAPKEKSAIRQPTVALLKPVYDAAPNDFV
jgi:hypothetical protein